MKASFSPSRFWIAWAAATRLPAGLIYAMLHDYKPMDMLNFAVASSVIKHTIHGDANITDDVSSIRNLWNRITTSAVKSDNRY